jgi:hypothetical protein
MSAAFVTVVALGTAAESSVFVASAICVLGAVTAGAGIVAAAEAGIFGRRLCETSTGGGTGAGAVARPKNHPLPKRSRAVHAAIGIIFRE